MCLSTFNGFVQFFNTRGANLDPLGAVSTMQADTASAHTMTQQMQNVSAIDVLTLFGRYSLTIRDHVVVKLDVEGAEYDILMRAITHGLIQFWGAFYIEWHHDNEYNIWSLIARTTLSTLTQTCCNHSSLRFSRFEN